MPIALDHPVALDRAGSAPAHVLIERWFTEAISAGELVPGDRLPREQDLALTFGVSRMTLRQALQELEGRGVVRRTPGRAGGTFITAPRIDCDLTGLTGFTEQLRRAHVRAGAKVVEAVTVPAPRAVSSGLELDRDAPVHKVVRVRSARREPLALECSYFPAAVLPELLAHRLTGSLYTLLRRAYGLEPHTAVEFLDPVVVDGTDAALLDVAPGAAVMRIERVARTAAGLPVEFARDLFRPDRVRISVRSGL